MSTEVATAQLQVTFRGTVTALQAEEYLKQWGLRMEYSRSSEDAIILIVSVPGNQALTLRVWLEQQSNVVTDVEEMR